MLGAAEIYDPKLDTWTSVSPMSTPRGGHWAVLLPDGRALVGGGCADGKCTKILSSAEIFDPATNAFTTVNGMTEGRFGALALALPNGPVLVSQGCESSTECDLTNELFSPLKGTFAQTQPAITARAFHAVAYVPSRTMVVAVGGCQPKTCSWWNETWDVSSLVGGTDAGAPEASAPEAAAPARCADAFDTITSGWDHTLATDARGLTWVWGQNSEGQLGLGDRAHHPLSTIAGGRPFVRLAGGSRHSCGVRTDGTLWCWGANYEGQLGVGDFVSRTSPTQVGTDTDWKDITCGGLHSCGLKVDGSIWCWGANGLGQLGHGDGPNEPSPKRIDGNGPWLQLSATTRFVCAIRDDHSLWCWGDDSNGQLGVGDTSVRKTPTRVGTGSSWQLVRTGALHACAIDAEGALYCWGANESGQLGLGDTRERHAPERVGTDSDWTYVRGGFAHTCGIRGKDKTLFCWGDDAKKQLATNASSTTPVRVGSDYSFVTLGQTHTCALRRGIVSCWGDRTWGQVDGTIDPTPVGDPHPICNTEQPPTWSVEGGGCSCNASATSMPREGALVLLLLGSWRLRRRAKDGRSVRAIADRRGSRPWRRRARPRARASRVACGCPRA